VDFCSDCKGVWFERGELARMVELSRDVPDIQDALRTARTTDLCCPRCKSGLKEIRYTKLNALLVDYCASCEGLWLDAGELSTVEGLATVLESAGSRLGRALKQLHDEGYVSAC
jgi:Zn-finger nucleic acid-binding protein